MNLVVLLSETSGYSLVLFVTAQFTSTEMTSLQ